MIIEQKQVIGLIDALAARALNNVTVTAGAGLTGGGDLTVSMTLALTGNALALHNLGTNGLVVRTGAGAIAAREILGTAGRIAVVNGDGVADDPTIDLASGVATPGTYTSVTVDTYGRVTTGTNPTTLAGYGITDALALAGGTMTGTIVFHSSMGTANPTLNAASPGTRLVLRNTAGVGNSNYAIGYHTNKMWFSVQANSGSHSFDFYGGNVPVAVLTGAGDFTLSGGLSAATKSFVIPHPSKKGWVLQHGSLEGPEHGVYLRGKVIGQSYIEIPDYWRKLVKPDSITVHLTSNNGLIYVCLNASIQERTIQGKRVRIIKVDTTEPLYSEKYDFTYLVIGERMDVLSLVVERKKV